MLRGTVKKTYLQVLNRHHRWLLHLLLHFRYLVLLLPELSIIPDAADDFLRLDGWEVMDGRPLSFLDGSSLLVLVNLQRNTFCYVTNS
jgi:hypothetical protein